MPSPQGLGICFATHSSPADFGELCTIHLKKIKDMKSPKVIAAILILGAFVAACGKVEKILPKKDGTWKIAQIDYREYSTAGLDSSYTDLTSSESYEFDKDGTGTVTDGSDIVAFTWSVSNDGDEISICYDILGGIFFCVKNEVLESEKNRQVWTNTDKEDGDSTWTESDVTLERVD